MDSDESNIIRFPSKGYAIDAWRARREEPVLASWELISIDREGGLYSVTAWTGPPSCGFSDRLFLGVANDLVEATNLARMKGRDLGVTEFVDFSSVEDDEEPVGAA